MLYAGSVNDGIHALLESQPAEGRDYPHLLRLAGALFEGEPDFIANAANLSALLYESLPDLNWCGFYLLRGADLVLGPFQGKIACVRIPLGRGVCGTSAQRRQTLIVPDVEAFPDHIVCDAASRSEIVVPLVAAGRVLGVLDIDSPSSGRFDERDGEGLEQIAELLLAASEPPRLD